MALLYGPTARLPSKRSLSRRQFADEGPGDFRHFARVVGHLEVAAEFRIRLDADRDGLGGAAARRSNGVLEYWSVAASQYSNTPPLHQSFAARVLLGARLLGRFAGMSATEILMALPELSEEERRTVLRRLAELEASGDATKRTPASCTLKDVVRLWRSGPSDDAFADDLETVNRSDRPLRNPWD